MPEGNAFESFGRRGPAAEPAGPAELAAPITPSIVANIVPVLAPEVREALADEIRMTIAEAVMAGFADGMNAFREASGDAAVDAAP